MKHDLDQVFDFIVEHKKANDGNSPTIREIGDACDISSTSVVVYLLAKLADDGKIRVGEFGKSRNISVVGAEWNPPRNLRSR